HQVEAQLLSPEKAVALEPALAAAAPSLAGAIHHPPDAHGDAHLFCCGLERALRASGVEFDYDTHVTGWVRAGHKVAALETESRLIEADAFVLAAGSHSVELARKLGIQIPVRPAKGYSITLELDSESEHPRMPVIDESLRIALTPLGQRLRAAGTAEFAGYDTQLSESRIQNLLDMLESVYPRCAKTAHQKSMTPWCGLRPVSADGVPVLGSTATPNLFLNTGHGPLGWTLAAGSARMLADLMSGHRPELAPEPYSLDRFRFLKIF
ncbi:FAD-dependent oxidoreductase, partial [Myxococcota bacterium]|nr:FAD-dependent oxidoreductase [Myxococcota bacterium]